MFCFYKTGAAHRPGNGRVAVKDLDPNLCTHMVYQFITLTSYGSIETMDSDLVELQQFIKLKGSAPWVKMLVSIGGPSQSSRVLSRLTSIVSLRRAVVIAIFDFVQQYGLDGVDIYWKYPVLMGGDPLDRENYVKLLSQLRDELKPAAKILTVSVAPTKDYFVSSYDVVAMNNYVDFINVMAFDLHAYWNARTGHNAPVYRASVETSRTERELNVDFIINGWIATSIPPSKIILGVTASGHSFKLADTSASGVRDRTVGPGPEGLYTTESGVLSYLEVCELIKKGGWTTVWDKEQNAQYSYKADLWVSYESKPSLEMKINLAKAAFIGGFGMWAVEDDDVKNVCGGGNSTLLSFIFDGLGLVYKDKPPQEGSLPEICPPSGYARDPIDCTKFYRCVGGSTFSKLSTNSCAPGLYFDTKINVCNWAKSVQC